MSLEAWALTTLADTKLFLRIFNEAQFDAELEALINEVSARTDIYCGRRLKSTVYQKTVSPASDTRLVLDGNGRIRIRLPQFPVTTLTSAVSVEGGVETALDLTNARVDVEAGIVTLDADIWTAGEQNILVTCTAGYLATTHARELLVLRRAAHLWLATWWLEQKNAVSGAIEVEGVKLPEEDPPARVAQILEPFVRKEWG